MTINKFQGKTEEEAVTLAKEAMGQEAVIMSVRLVKPKGLFGFLKTSMYEVTAAVEEKDTNLKAAVTPRASAKPAELESKVSIDLSADEDLSIKDIQSAKADVSSSYAYEKPMVRHENTQMTETSKNPKAVSEGEDSFAPSKDFSGNKGGTSKKDILSETDYIGEKLGNLQSLLEQTLAERMRNLFDIAHNRTIRDMNISRRVV